MQQLQISLGCSATTSATRVSKLIHLPRKRLEKLSKGKMQRFMQQSCNFRIVQLYSHDDTEINQVAG